MICSIELCCTWVWFQNGLLTYHFIAYVGSKDCTPALCCPFNLKLIQAIKRTSSLFAAPIKYGQERVYPHILCCPFSLNMGMKECTPHSLLPL